MSAPAAAVVRCTLVGAVAVVALDRPRSRNSLVWESWAGLDEALDEALVASVRAVVLVGCGGYFSSGGDLKTTPARGEGPLAPVARLDRAQRVLRRLREFPVPVVAAVEGGAIGMGWSLVLSCDLVVASREAMFAAPFVARGVVPDGGAAWYLTERLGRHRASAILLAGERLSAQAAHESGLVATLCDAGSAESVALELAGAIAAADAGAVTLTKRLLHAAEGADLTRFLAEEQAVAALAQQGAAAAAGRRGFG
ncbi:enoyl-CoA hydratase/isomerase family protein [Pseudonocardia xishanensis]|uniref:Enoyl-CoA hydratase n=1 Tax=Pseudonocardia xishanensis TaxID=630995 RepID=A0ABP8RSY0_9PSEU